jgi:glycosyltransferase involved in cell wall biosynthesis
MATTGNRKIRICQIITRMDWGGSPDILRLLCKYLDPDLYDITLIIGDTRFATVKTRDFLRNFKGNVLVVPELIRNVNPFKDIPAFFKLLSILRKGRFQIAHTHTAKAGALGRLAALYANIPVIVHTPHGHNFYGYFNPLASKMIIFIERYLARFTDAIIALTELEKSDFVRYKVAPESKMRVIYQGLELEEYAKSASDRDSFKKLLRIQPDDLVAGVVSRIEPVKGVIYFVQAAKLVLERLPKAKFIIAGEGSQRAGLEQKVIQLGLKDSVIFAGWREDVPEILSILDVLVQPSLNEAVGISLLEAQAAGLAVVATSVGGIPEVVKDGTTGILVPPGDISKISQAIIALLSDSAKRQSYGREGRRWVSGKFSVEIMAKNTSSLYEELVLGGKG